MSLYISTCKTRRAKGGTGIIVPGVVCVDYPRGKTVAQQLRLDQLKYINGYSRMAQEIHRYGALLILQLHHTGMSTDVLTTELALIRALHKPPLEMVVHDLSGPVLPYY